MNTPRQTQRLGLVVAAQRRRIVDLEREVVRLSNIVDVLLYSEPKAAPKQPKRKPPKAEMRAASMRKVAAAKMLHPAWTMAQVAASCGLSLRYCRELWAEWQARTAVR